MWLLRDPLKLTESQVIMPAILIKLLNFFDGTRTLPQIHAAFNAYLGRFVDPRLILHTFSMLDEACLLKNERSGDAKAALLARFRGQAYRPPALAGVNYPADPDALSQRLNDFAISDYLPIKRWQGRGVISPHIDYHRGGAVYAKVWRRAMAAVKEADLVLIFGTDHSGGQIITLTELPYATPYGILPTDRVLISQLAMAVGPDVAFANELHHREEHSIELSAVWLHHTFDNQAACPMVPILCGSFHHFVRDGGHPKQDERLNRFIETLQAQTADKKVLAVASVDLAHVGPAFGDKFPMNRSRRRDLRKSDKSLIEAITTGDADRFYHEIAQVEDKNRICGFSSIYLLLRYLEKCQGREVVYRQCRADRQDTSLVSICGVLLD